MADQTFTLKLTANGYEETVSQAQLDQIKDRFGKRFGQHYTAEPNQPAKPEPPATGKQKLPLADPSTAPAQ